jgi:sterol-4alpha-carboxylate 3-dehydrogenase (decarboxylating)
MFPWSPKVRATTEDTTTAPIPPPTPQPKLQPPGFHSPHTDTTALVTGACGLCGARMIELLFERGTTTIIAIDVAIPNATLRQRFDTIVQQGKTNPDGSPQRTLIERFGPELGDITNDTAVRNAFTSCAPSTTLPSSSSTSASPVNVVYHIAALVGPFYDRQLYYDVNYVATQRIIRLCQEFNVPKLIYSSSPGTRFTGANIEGLTEDELPIPKTFLATYAETKAMGEVAVREANSDTLHTISVAPHQIYGPHDTLFLMKFLEVCGTNRLRIFGTGQYLISICYVDNYCHGLMCGADTLIPESNTLGKFYIITDGNEPRNLWHLINEASIEMGFTDLTTKLHLPIWFLYIIATIANIIGYVLNMKFKLNYFSLRMSTMHRYFNIKNAMTDLQYQPIVPYEVAWPRTIQWFKENWLPEFMEKQNIKMQNDHKKVQ